MQVFKKQKQSPKCLQRVLNCQITFDYNIYLIYFSKQTQLCGGSLTPALFWTSIASATYSTTYDDDEFYHVNTLDFFLLEYLFDIFCKILLKNKFFPLFKEKKISHAEGPKK